MTPSKSPTRSQLRMTERNPTELAESLLQDDEFIKALAVAISRHWGLGDSPEWFFERLVRKVRRVIPGGSFDAQVIPMVFESPGAKEAHALRNDLRSLSYSLEIAQRRGETQIVKRLTPQVEKIKARLEELGNV